MILRSRLLATVAAIALALVMSACGGGQDESGPDVPLSPTGEIGLQTVRDKGCTSCHGSDGSGGTGPPWVGLAGSVRPLDDGTEVVADRDYLIRSITEPQADQVDGYNIRMPLVSLDENEIAAIVTLIEELG